MKLSILDGFGRVNPTPKVTLNNPIKGRTDKIGFSRIYDYNEPGRKNLDGFSRLTYTNQELQGLSLQGVALLNGYSLGDTQDLDEWEHLVNIEHPIVLNGFPNFILNGKRAEKKAARQEKKAEKKEARQEKKTTKQAKREERKGAGSDRGRRRKEVRVAKKEEKLLKKQTRREDRTNKKEASSERKQSRIDQRTDRRALKEETKRLKAAARGERGGRIGEALKNISEDLLPNVLDIARGGGDLQNFTSGDFNYPDPIENFLDYQRGQDPEDVLDLRDEILEESDPGQKSAELDSDQDEKKSNLPLIAGGGLLLLMAMNKKKKKKK